MNKCVITCKGFKTVFDISKNNINICCYYYYLYYYHYILEHVTQQTSIFQNSLRYADNTIPTPGWLKTK